MPLSRGGPYGANDGIRTGSCQMAVVAKCTKCGSLDTRATYTDAEDAADKGAFSAWTFDLRVDRVRARRGARARARGARELDPERPLTPTDRDRRPAPPLRERRSRHVPAPARAEADAQTTRATPR